jgi:hypothetical protein
MHENINKIIFAIALAVGILFGWIYLDSLHYANQLNRFSLQLLGTAVPMVFDKYSATLYIFDSKNQKWITNPGPFGGQPPEPGHMVLRPEDIQPIEGRSYTNAQTTAGKILLFGGLSLAFTAQLYAVAIAFNQRALFGILCFFLPGFIIFVARRYKLYKTLLCWGLGIALFVVGVKILD